MLIGNRQLHPCKESRMLACLLTLPDYSRHIYKELVVAYKAGLMGID